MRKIDIKLIHLVFSLIKFCGELLIQNHILNNVIIHKALLYGNGTR